VPSSPLGVAYPARHLQFVCFGLPAGADVFAGQFMHAFALVAAGFTWYLSAGQSAQASAPVEVLYFPATHATHSLLTVSVHAVVVGR
jgi:hypothetical protein